MMNIYLRRSDERKVLTFKIDQNDSQSLSFSVSLWFSLSLSVSFFLSLLFCLSVSVCLSVCLSDYLSLSLSHSKYTYITKNNNTSVNETGKIGQSQYFLRDHSQSATFSNLGFNSPFSRTSFLCKVCMGS